MSAATQTDVARVLLAALASAGVRDIVVSPGSRSTPFVIAAQRAEMEMHVVIDERSAGFVALGIARVTRRPTLLLCTSGSAGAHWLPALIEARQAHVPLIALTADRPHDQAQCDAPQTIEQVGLFGSYVCRTFDIAVPDERTSTVDAAMRFAVQAYATSIAPDPGPVHVNARVSKPLEPVAPSSDAEHAFHAYAERACERGATRVWPAASAPSPEAVRALADACRRAERGLIVAGPASLGRRSERAAVLDLARVTTFPIAAEATSQLRFLDRDATEGVTTADGLLGALRSKRARERAISDVVIQIGDSPVASGWESFCAEDRARERWVIAPHGWCDPFGRADARIVSDVGSAARALATAIGERRATHRDGAIGVSDAWWRAIEATDGPSLDETGTVREVVAQLPEGSLLSIGNSRAVRLLESCRSTGRDVAVMSQRGASGIDGLVAGAVGATHAWRGPVALVLGDVSFAHDVGALALVRDVRTPLVIVVVNNDGGRIFEDLPVAQAWGATPEPWTTPHGLEVERIASAFGIASRRVDDQVALAAAIDDAMARTGPTVVEVRVAPEAERARREHMDAALESALASKEQRA